ncbi:Na+/H+ antiporter NhaC family protein [Sporosarcina sp. 179-K 3D1 HS]|uniref:Na+/H+ antiporter family protein n=1 Tax=Sporosarcina sp. 179-K 3D1 HS TaxID=3232169 RepID=UPI0039A0061F
MLLSSVVISVIVMAVLSLLRVNVIFAILAAAGLAGLMEGLSLAETTTILVSGMGGQANTALSYILLGMFAVMIGMSGIAGFLVKSLINVLKGKRAILVLAIAGVSCLSQNVVPIHIAFIPILIPPMLHLFDKMQIDRRALAAALTFGLKAPYIMVPAGFGLIFKGIIIDEMKAGGMDISLATANMAMLIPGSGMIVGLLVAIFITYRKKRDYGDGQAGLVNEEREEAVQEQDLRFTYRHVFTIASILTALAVQLITDTLILGALAGIFVMFVTNVIPFRDGDKIVNDGIGMMGMIAFVMLIASGYATVLKETGAVNTLVTSAADIIGDNKVTIAIVMLLVGLLITMGIGSSFGTIPIIAALFVPICAAVGFSPMATAALIGTAGALGDAGSPASDSTLGPTAGLNADGKHNHIWDSCVPTFLHYSIPLFLFGLIAAVVL